MQVTVKGRGRLEAVASADEMGAVIRLDDAARPEFWAEVRLTRQQLAELLTEANRLYTVQYPYEAAHES